MLGLMVFSWAMAIRAAAVEELAEVVPRRVAEALHQYLRSDGTPPEA